MSKTEIPEWAIDKATALAKPEGLGAGSHKHDGHYYGDMRRAFARYIAAHEEAPVDPTVAAGRQVVVDTQHNFADSPWHQHEAAETLAGRRDRTLVVMAAIDGVRRGIELAGQSVK